MSDTARDYYQTIDPATTEGLQDLFSVHERACDSQCDPVDSQCDSVETSLILTAAEASAHLRIPISTIYRRIKAGKFNTTEGPDGAVRIILPHGNENENHAIPTNANSENQIVELILTDSQSESCENQVIITDSDGLDKVLGLLAEKDKKLEAATYRVGYLEAQLAAKDDQIKLLTDSQQKPGWWQRFYTWFIGR